MTIDNGGYAFPCATSNEQHCHIENGMALRDWFAGKALVSLTAEYFKGNGMCFATDHLFSNLPSHAYRMADAMLKARQS